jgi:hypothetical protein
MSAVGRAEGEALALGDALAPADALADAEALAVVVVVAIEVRVAVGGGTVPPSAGMNPAPPVGDGAGIAGSSEQATTNVASRADRIVRTPTDRGC